MSEIYDENELFSPHHPHYQHMLKHHKSLSHVLGIDYDWLKNAWIPIETEMGWFPIIRDLFNIIAKSRVNEPNSIFSISQIKEKFGELRVYLDYECSEALSEIVDKIIKEAEFEARKTCELCGKQGSLTQNYYQSLPEQSI